MLYMYYSRSRDPRSLQLPWYFGPMQWSGSFVSVSRREFGAGRGHIPHVVVHLPSADGTLRFSPNLLPRVYTFDVGSTYMYCYGPRLLGKAKEEVNCGVACQTGMDAYAYDDNTSAWRWVSTMWRVFRASPSPAPWAAAAAS